MLSATDHLNQIFGARNGVVNWLRGTGLDVINEVGWIKKVFMAGAGAGVKVTGTGAGAGAGVGRNAGLGWQGLLANAVEGAGQLRGVVGGVASMAGGMLKSSMRRGPPGRGM
jgi:ubiquinone biosynthesis monooxygenase Coq6